MYFTTAAGCEGKVKLINGFFFVKSLFRPATEEGVLLLFIKKQLTDIQMNEFNYSMFTSCRKPVTSLDSY